jgi:GST-like protein
VHEYKHVRRWADEIAARPAVMRGRKVNKVRGNPEEQVPERHSGGGSGLRS